MIDTKADTTTEPGFIDMATPDEYAARIATKDQVRGYLVPGFLA
jgi:hypothetical protein